MFIPRSRIIVVVGHYGSGKSELAINLALKMSGSKASQFFLVDLDVVNPYFRSRECASYLREKGINVISSAESFPDVDLPYMPDSIRALFQDPEAKGVLDIGGDPAGARVLARYSKELIENNSDVYCVINANRPKTKTAKDTIRFINDIQGTSGLRITGLINDTHLLDKTEIQDIYRGAALAKEVSKETGIPVAGHAVQAGFVNEIEWNNASGELEIIHPIIPVDLFLKKPWE